MGVEFCMNDYCDLLQNDIFIVDLKFVAKVLLWKWKYVRRHNVVIYLHIGFESIYQQIISGIIRCVFMMEDIFLLSEISVYKLRLKACDKCHCFHFVIILRFTIYF